LSPVGDDPEKEADWRSVQLLTYEQERKKVTGGKNERRRLLLKKEGWGLGGKRRKKTCYPANPLPHHENKRGVEIPGRFLYKKGRRKGGGRKRGKEPGLREFYPTKYPREKGATEKMEGNKFHREERIFQSEEKNEKGEEKK